MTKRLLTIFGVFVLTAAFGRSAEAVPVLGGQLTYTGGDVTVTSLPVTSGYVSELGLYDESFIRLRMIMEDEPAGVVDTFDPGALFGVAIGDELIFGIRITAGDPLGEEYFMGPASRNPDNLLHAAVDDLGGSTFVVGFEDLFGGGDQDYDDNAFTFEGGVATTPVPEPASLSLLGIGLLTLVRRRSRATR